MWCLFTFVSVVSGRSEVSRQVGAWGAVEALPDVKLNTLKEY